MCARGDGAEMLSPESTSRLVPAGWLCGQALNPDLSSPTTRRAPKPDRVSWTPTVHDPWWGGGHPAGSHTSCVLHLQIEVPARTPRVPRRV